MSEPRIREPAEPAHRHSRYTGRPISLAYEIYEAISADVASLCQLPFALPSDHRHVANHHWICLEYRIMLDTVKMSKLSIEEQLRYVRDTTAEMTSLYRKNDSVAGMYDPAQYNASY